MTRASAWRKQNGTFLVMDIYNDTFILEHGASVGMLPESLEKERMIGQLQRDNFRKAFKAGVRMAFGSDGAVYPHGDNGKQFAYMVRVRHVADAGDPGRDDSRGRTDRLAGHGRCDRSRAVSRTWWPSTAIRSTTLRSSRTYASS